MARKKEALPAGSGVVVGEGAAPPAVLPGRWRVRLDLPAPCKVRRPEMVVEAESEQAARDAFCKANNISGSAHTWTVERLP